MPDCNDIAAGFIFGYILDTIVTTFVFDHGNTNEAVEQAHH